jgi:hypothetical protein
VYSFTWRLFDSVQAGGIWFAEEVSGIWEKLKGILGLGFFLLAFILAWRPGTHLIPRGYAYDITFRFRTFVCSSSLNFTGHCIGSHFFLMCFEIGSIEIDVS